MKKFISVFSILLVIAVVVFSLGPRPDSNDTITFKPEQIGSDIDGYLANAESNIPNLIPGAEKEVIWADSITKAKTPLSIIYIHGFSATKHEHRPVPDNVAKSLGANLYFTRLKGHGRDGEGLAEAKVQDWANDFAEAIEIGRRLGEKTLIMATSNGGMITTWGMAKPELSENVAGIVFSTPNFELHGISTWLANIPWAETILPAVAGRQRAWEPSNELHGKWWTTSYPSRAIFPMTAMLKLVKGIDKSKINIPALVFYAPDDKVVVSEQIEKVMGEWGGPVELIKVEASGSDSNHNLMGDIISPMNTEPFSRKITDWINALGD